MTILYNKKSLKECRRDLRMHMTQSETLLWSVLRGKQLGVKFQRQYSIGRYIADFCASRLKLVIELDGITHDDPIVQEKDRAKQKFLEERGFTVLHFKDSEVLGNVDNVLKKIRKVCEQQASPFPLLKEEGMEKP